VIKSKLRSLLLTFTLILFPQAVVYAQQSAPAPDCVTEDAVKADAAKYNVALVRVEGAELQRMIARIEKEGYNPTQMDLFLIAKIDPKEWALFLFKNGCLQSFFPKVPPENVLKYLEDTPA